MMRELLGVFLLLGVVAMMFGVFAVLGGVARAQARAAAEREADATKHPPITPLS